jgi:hypothetical protein
VQVEGLLTALGGTRGKSKDGTRPISETKGYIEKHGKLNKETTKRKI